MGDAPTPVVLRVARDLGIRHETLIEALQKHGLSDQPLSPEEGAKDCICVRRGDGPEGCGVCNETGVLPAASRPSVPAEGVTASGDDEEEAYQTGVRDGYEKAVQDIDLLTGGDGEYRFCTNGDPERHTPDAQTMKKRIVDRFAALSPVENSPSPALGGTEAEGRSEHKDHPTPVGGLEPVAWATKRELAEVASDRSPLGRHLTIYRHPASGAHEPLYSSSTVSTQQAEIERLREALKEARPDIIGYVSARGSEYEGSPKDAVAFIDQALGGSHD